MWRSHVPFWLRIHTVMILPTHDDIWNLKKSCLYVSFQWILETSFPGRNYPHLLFWIGNLGAGRLKSKPKVKYLLNIPVRTWTQFLWHQNPCTCLSLHQAASFLIVRQGKNFCSFVLGKIQNEIISICSKFEIVPRILNPGTNTNKRTNERLRTWGSVGLVTALSNPVKQIECVESGTVMSQPPIILDW